MRCRALLATVALAGMTAGAAPAGACTNAGTKLTSSNAAKVEKAAVCLVNRERTKRGLKALKVHAKLVKAAKDHSRDMKNRNYFDHTGKDGSSFGERVKRAGYPGFGVGENIAGGQDSARDLMNSWMSSKGHKDNILSRGAKEIGIGAVVGGRYGTLWTLVTGARRSGRAAQSGPRLEQPETKCADAAKRIAVLGPAKTERSLLCVLSEFRRKNGATGLRADARVRKAAAATMRSGNYAISRIVKELDRAGFFRNGGRGFRRCSAIPTKIADTPGKLADAILRYERFVIAPPHTYAGLAIRNGKAFLLVGRKR